MIIIGGGYAGIAAMTELLHYASNIDPKDKQLNNIFVASETVRNLTVVGN